MTNRRGLCVCAFYYLETLISELVYTTLNINTRKVKTDMGCAENSNYIVRSGIFNGNGVESMFAGN